MDDFVLIYVHVRLSSALFNANLLCRNEMRSSVSDTNDVCKRAIDEYYLKFVDSLVNVSTVTVPVIKVNWFKHRWSDELTELKQKSIDIFRIWRDAGSGMMFDMYLQNKYFYTLCITKMKHDSEHVITNDLQDAL